MTLTSHTPSARKSRFFTLIGHGGRDNSLVVNVTVGVAALLMVGSAIIHLHLWSTGYRHIPTIGWLFLVQGISAIVLGVALGALRRLWVVAAAFLFVSSTIGGFLLSVSVGLFGFKDSWSAPYAGMAFGLELAVLVVLAVAAAGILHASNRAAVGGYAPN